MEQWQSLEITRPSICSRRQHERENAGDDPLRHTEIIARPPSY